MVSSPNIDLEFRRVKELIPIAYQFWLWLRSPNPMWHGVSKRSNDLTMSAGFDQPYARMSATQTTPTMETMQPIEEAGEYGHNIRGPDCVRARKRDPHPCPGAPTSPPKLVGAFEPSSPPHKGRRRSTRKTAGAVMMLVAAGVVGWVMQRGRVAETRSIGAGWDTGTSHTGTELAPLGGPMTIAEKALSLIHI